MVNTRLQVAYDGTAFAGWAPQPEARTVAGELARSLDALHAVRGDLIVAGRTDAGVHASGQVVSVQREAGPPTASLARALNDQLPPDIAVLAAEDVAADFSARSSAPRSATQLCSASRVSDRIVASTVKEWPWTRR